MRRNSIFHHPAKVFGAGSLLFAMLMAGQPALAGIVNSKHDLSSGSTTTGAKQSTTSEVCVFCHTPHGASNAAPLWNRGAPGSASFTVYTSASMDGTANQPSASSGLCLSCHDGATALDLLINAPGSGYGAGTGTAVTQAYNFGTTAGVGNVMKSGIANLGADLGNDHPISIPYCGGTSGTACKDPDFKITGLYKNTGGTVTQPTNPTAAAGDYWWIDTGTVVGAKDKTDLPLYVATFGASTYAAVECATCHEPHNGGAAGTPFLRIANASSALCTACHNK